jgi:hypothetical protein
MNAEFNCKIKSKTKPNIKWMKQITRLEYAKYIVQNNLNSDDIANLAEIVSSDQGLKQKNKDTRVLLNDDDEEFYSASTLSPLSVIETNTNNHRQTDSNLDETLFLSDLISQNLHEKSKKDDFNFELYVPNGKNFNINEKKAKKSLLNNNIDESVHYITLSSSPLITEQLSFDKEHSYYISKLTIKQVEVKDSGIYVCFGGDAKEDSSYNSRKSYLKVLPLKQHTLLNEKLYRKSDTNLMSSLLQQQEQRTKNFFSSDYQNKNNFFIKNEQIETTTTIATSSLTDAFRSNSFLIVLIPILLITAFAIASIFYLKRMEDRKIKNGFAAEQQNRRCNFYDKSLFKFFYGENSKMNNEKNCQSIANCKSSSINSYSYCPSSEINPSTLIQTLDESDALSERPRNGKKSNNKKLTNSYPCATNSLGSASSSTTATTVAYYAAIPLLIDNNNSSSSSLPPPPLPNSPPPTFSPSFSVNSKLNTSSPNYNFKNTPSSNVHFQNSNLERVISTPSLAYYKIVDCDLIDCNDSAMNENQNQKSKKLDFNLDHTDVSTNSQFYYQLSPDNLNR